VLDGDAAAERAHAIDVAREMVSAWSKNQCRPSNGIRG
jgi:hypothetical protein